VKETMNSDLAKSKVFLALLYCMTTIAGSAQAEQTTVSVGLSAADASDQWHFSDDRATIAAGTLRLDGRSSPTYAFLKSPAWGDVIKLRRSFAAATLPKGGTN
jgi:hypothetical protein